MEKLFWKCRNGTTFSPQPTKVKRKTSGKKISRIFFMRRKPGERAFSLSTPSLYPSLLSLPGDLTQSCSCPSQFFFTLSLASLYDSPLSLSLSPTHTHSPKQSHDLPLSPHQNTHFGARASKKKGVWGSAWKCWNQSSVLLFFILVCQSVIPLDTGWCKYNHMLSVK